MKEKIEAIEHFLYRKHTNATAKAYLYNIDVFLMTHPKARDYKYSDIIDYLNELKSKGCDKTLRPILASLKRYYDYLVETGQRDDHPCKRLNLKIKKLPIQLQDLFSSKELELLMNRENRYSDLELRNKVIISFLIYQGLASSEIVRLRLEDVDLDNGTMYITGSKKIASRLLNLKTKQILLIQNYIEISRRKLVSSTHNENLLLTMRGDIESVDTIHAMIEPLKVLYPDRNLTPTIIRQSVISNLLNEEKHSLEAVQLFAGHRWPSSTEQYQRKDINEQLEKVNMWHPLR